MKKTLKHPLVVSIVGLVIGSLILHFVPGLTIPDGTVVNVKGDGNATAVGNNAQAITNEVATFNLVSKDVRQNQVVLTIQGTEGILPARLCAIVSTDAEIYYVASSFSGLRDGDRQTMMCFTNPPKEFTLTYDVTKEPSFFNVEIK